MRSLYRINECTNVFQSLIKKNFNDILNIDYILIYPTSYENHICHVLTVLTCLLQNYFYIKPEKCEFDCRTITFLGYVVSEENVEMDQSQVQAVTERPEPTTVKELQRFLGFANFYRHFIRNYSMVTAPLKYMLKGKPRKLLWSDLARSAFSNLKLRFNTAPILHHPNPDLPFVVEVKASSCGIGLISTSW